ncbi:hypothetical protein [Paludisphaera mucosa]|uniref:AlgX/AlgJ SGNH hydrolase-like domain-containing protein n=1 Tax=Paludisphaera mucosa TaxID=3030827 RepID=A0ABT6F5Y5_9BACT|nr:hypothetical protein [Paludisphaera mucosa]MDG3002997.1 hypothetical protein [Paludisphaera mucosa]
MNESVVKELFGRLPWGFLGMIAMVFAIERFAIRDIPLYPEPGGRSWNHSSTGIARKTAGRDVVYFGDSLVKNEVLPKIVEEQSGKSGYNLALHSGSAPSSYYLLRRMVDSGVRPSSVLVDFEKSMLEIGPASPTRPFPWSELLTPSEAFQLAWQAGDPALFADILVKRTLRSARIRLEIRNSIMFALGGEVDREREITYANWRNFNRNEGAFVLDKNPAYQDTPILSGFAETPAKWNCDPVNAVYVRKFLRLAAQIEARVYLLLPPISPGSQSIHDHWGLEPPYVEFVRGLQDHYPNVVVLDARRMGFKSDVFYDWCHLDRDGVVVLSERIGAAIRETWDQKTASRWIALRPFGPRTGNAPYEVITDTFAKLRADRAVTFTR